ncbi:YeiH family protein [Nocardioides dongkuii]|uniref:YeiH family protein n=1 Tax=Nocardioides dongkuii TaxID=2760089 RepID=UPI0015FAC616|nr:putative sulfate exporter family transporter [Nocardioides dongkuii]
MPSRVLPALPGLLLAAAGGAAAVLVHARVPLLGATLVAVVAGLAVGAAGLPGASLRPGLRVASRQVLRVGVALLGLQLALDDVTALGWPVLAVAAGVVGLGILGTLALARLLGVDREQALLVACGFSICGAAAVAAVDGVRRSRDEDVAAAVSLVVVFGSAAMLGLPAAALLLGLDPVGAGAWAGASVHEVGQVVVAGGLLGGAALQVAVVVKLARVLLLAPVLAVVSWRTRATGPGTRPPLVPAFVVAFAVLAAARSASVVPPVALEAASVVQSAALATAMFALGCSVDVRVLRRTARPLLGLAAGATALVTLVGLPAAYLV